MEHHFMIIFFHVTLLIVLSLMRTNIKNLLCSILRQFLPHSVFSMILSNLINIHFLNHVYVNHRCEIKALYLQVYFVIIVPQFFLVLCFIVIRHCGYFSYYQRYYCQCVFFPLILV